jgi:hypothetical protein
VNFAAAAEHLRRQEIARLCQYVAPPVETLRSLTPGPFRELIALMLERLAYTVENNPTAAELVVTKDDNKTIVICATPSDPHPAGTRDVARLHEVVLAQNAQRGVYITTRSFTADARDYAASMPAVIKLLDGDALQKWLNKSVEDMKLPTQYKAMCHVCGETVQHNLDHGKPLPCINDHMVVPTIARSAIERRRHPQQPDESRPKLQWRSMTPKAQRRRAIKAHNHKVYERAIKQQGGG